MASPRTSSPRISPKLLLPQRSYRRFCLSVSPGQKHGLPTPCLALLLASPLRYGTPAGKPVGDHLVVRPWRRINNLLSIAYAFRPRLRPG